jgi:hypothetical protein
METQLSQEYIVMAWYLIKHRLLVNRWHRFYDSTSSDITVVNRELQDDELSSHPPAELKLINVYPCKVIYEDSGHSTTMADEQHMVSCLPQSSELVIN